ncbi:hypothetical protein GQ457_15G020060 [Hibiscus cannabinus]
MEETILGEFLLGIDGGYILKTRILSWNIRGIGFGAKLSRIRQVLRKHKIDILFLQETKKLKVEENDVREFWGDDDFSFCYSEAVEFLLLRRNYNTVMSSTFSRFPLACKASMRTLWNCLFDLKKII